MHGKEMPAKLVLVPAFIFGAVLACIAEEETKPIELGVLKSYIGVWDGEIEVWPMGLEAASIKFKCVETNRAYGKHWIASDLDSEFMGQTMKVHSIIGYDLDQRQMVGTVIDDGPYAASMTGDYDADSKTVSWTTKVKDASGKPVVQKTLITQEHTDERVLVLSVPNKENDGFTKFMQITFVRRK